MAIEKSKVKRILVITLSNVGDVILTMPVITTLAEEFPGARIDVMVGPRGKEALEKDPRVFKLIIYDKHMPISAKRRLQLKLKKLRYDLVVDLKNTIFPLLIAPRYRTTAIQRFPANIIHSMDRHLYRLQALGINEPQRRADLHIGQEDLAFVEKLLKDESIEPPFALVNPGAKSHLKRWTQEGFALLADAVIAECKTSVIFIGLEEDRQTVDGIILKMKNSQSGCHNVVGKTNLRQLAELLKRSKLLITNDSAPLHLGCALGAKVLALFGPTDPKKYGPTGEFDTVINRKLHCSPCESATCEYNYECMTSIDPDEVIDAAKLMIEGYG